MLIQWAGLACFKIEGENATIVFDPFDPSCGLRLPRLSADIVISSSQSPNHGNTKAVSAKSEPIKIITGAGEYEKKEALLYGMHIQRENDSKKENEGAVIYRIQLDGVNVVHLGNLSFPLQNSQLDHLEKTDILFLPVGGGDYLSGKAGAELANQIEPRVIIPMCYKVPGLKARVSGTEDFCKEIGICPKEKVVKFKVSKKDLPQDLTQVVIFDIM